MIGFRLFMATAVRVVGGSLLLATLILVGVRCSSGPRVEPEPPRPREWSPPPPPEEPLRIADAHWDCAFGLSDDGRARLDARCEADGGSAAMGFRHVECLKRDAHGTLLWKFRANEFPFERVSHSGYAKQGSLGWVVLR